ncbi:MAG: cell division protein FtsL [Myxococcota bacterium]
MKRKKRRKRSQQAAKRWRAAGAFMIVAAVMLSCALFYVWTRHQVTTWGYKISEAADLQDELKQANRELRLEAASLRSPRRVEKIARKELGLDFAKPGQIQPLN